MPEEQVEIPREEDLVMRTHTRYCELYMGRALSLDKLPSELERPIEWMGCRVNGSEHIYE